MSKFICPDRNDWIIGIKRVSNGFVVQEVTGTDDEVKIEEFAYQEKEDVLSDEKDLEVMADLLFHIKEFLGCSYSKHKKKNIEIKIVDSGE